MTFPQLIKSWWLTIRLAGVYGLFPRSGLILGFHFEVPQSGEMFRLKEGQCGVIAWNRFDMEKT